MEQKIEYQTILDEAIKEIDSKVGDYEEARNKLIILLEQINPIIDPKTTIFSFDNIIDYTLFNNRFNSDKKYIISEYPLFKFYYYIALTYLQEKEGWSPKETREILNKKSGVLGISGISSDERDISAACERGNERAILARKIQ
ncbi:MAG: hypothetical protein RR623_05110, partial [Bacilli bacterium]